MFINNIMFFLTLPGIMVHELAHAFFVSLSSAKITEFKITSHVAHEGRYTYTSIFFISYAPLVINTILALILAGVFFSVTASSFRSQVALYISFYLAVCLAIHALPSYDDAVAPYNLFKNIISDGQIVYAVLGIPFLLIIAAPGILMTWIANKSRILRWIVDCLFALFVIAIAYKLSLTGIHQMIVSVL